MIKSAINSAKGSYRFWLSVLTIFAILATVQIIFLTMQNRELKQVIAGRKQAQPVALKPGDQVQAFSSIDANGKENTVSYEDADYLLLITSTKCPWCARTMPIWKDISEKAKGKLRIVAVSIDGQGELANYVRDNGINFDVVNFADPAARIRYKAFGTPQTIFIKRGGIVARTWQGMLTEQTENQITNLFAESEKGGV